MSTPTTFKGLVNTFIGIIEYIIPVIISVTFVVVIWKIFDAWVIHADDEKKRAEGKQVAITATIVMVIIFVTWGIVRILGGSFFGSV